MKNISIAAEFAHNKYQLPNSIPPFFYLFTLIREDDKQTAQQLQAEISFRDL